MAAKINWHRHGTKLHHCHHISMGESRGEKGKKTTGPVPAMKPEATAIGDPQDGRWKITLMFDGRRFCVLKFRYSTLQQTTRQ